MNRKKKTFTPNMRMAALYLLMGVLLLLTVTLFSGQESMRATEDYFARTISFVKVQSTSFEKNNDTITAKALRRMAVAVRQLAENDALDLYDPESLRAETESLWLTGIAVLDENGKALCEYTSGNVGYAQFAESLREKAALNVLQNPQKTYLKRILLQDGTAVDVATHRAAAGDAILLAYRVTPPEFVEGTALSIQSVLDGYPQDISGTIFIVQDNKVIAANDSTYMVHPVRMGACGYYNAEELQKYIEAMNAIRESIVGLYAKKTGRDKDEVAGWMDETSWWTAAQAKENGFIDELTDEADGAVIENRDGLLFVNSVNTHLPFDKAPNFVQSSKAAPASCSVNNKCHKEVTNMANEIKTVDDLRGAYPALVNEIEEAAANKATSDERQRIHDIEDMALSGSEALTNEAKFTKPVSASEYAVAMMKAAKESGNAWLNGAKADADKSGMGGVKNDGGTGGGTGKQDEFMDAIKSMGKKQ